LTRGIVSSRAIAQACEEPVTFIALSGVSRPLYHHRHFVSWAYTAMPWTDSDLLRDCFDVAMKLRVLDMQASPYDLRTIGFEPVRIETADGRAEYQRREREMAARAGVLRGRLIDAVSAPLRGQRAVVV
jgi:hypothetical protein